MLHRLIRRACLLSPLGLVGLALAGLLDDSGDRNETASRGGREESEGRRKVITKTGGTHRSGCLRTKYIFALLAALRAGFLRGPEVDPSFATTGGPLVSARWTTLMSLTRGLRTLKTISTPVLPTRFLRRIEVSRPACRLRMPIRTPEKTVVAGEGFSGVGAVAYEVTVRTEPGRMRSFALRENKGRYESAFGCWLER